MPTRATRNLSEDISTALTELRKWRIDGCADKIVFWEQRLDYLLQRWKSE